MRRDRHPAVEAAEAVGAVELDRTPLGVEAVDPVVAAEGVGDADGEQILSAGVGGGGEVGLEGQLLHDGVADQLPVEVDLGAQMRSANVQEDALARHGRGDFDLARPPRDAEVGPVLRDGIVGGVAILIRRVGAWLAILPRSVLAPEMLLHRPRQCHRDPRRITQHAPPARRRVHRQRLTLASHYSIRTLRYILRQKDRVVLPLGVLIDPQPPALVWNQRAVLRPCVCVFVRPRRALRTGKLHLHRNRCRRCRTKKRASADLRLLHKP